MANINPRARGGNSLSATLADRKAREEQLGRQRVILPKPTPAPVAGGGIVGMVEINSTPGSVVMRAGQASMDYATVAYGAPADPYGGTVGTWASISGYQLILAPGWYNLTASVNLTWISEASAPPSLSVYIQGGWDAAHNNACVFARAALGSGANPGWGVEQVVSHGPTFIHDGDAVWMESTAGGNFPATDSADSYITWNITKYG